MTPDCTIIVRSPAELLAVTPYLLGFHPSDSLVVVGLSPGHQVVFCGRFDLDPPVSPADAADMAAVVGRQPADALAVVGYGPAGRVTPAVLQLTNALQTLGVRLNDAIRVTEGRWWSYLCEGAQCCPPDGTPCPPPGNAVATQAIFQGQVALPDRKALVAQVAAVTGTARERMAAATEQAKQRLTDLYGEDVRAEAAGRSIRKAGRQAIREAERRHQADRSLTDGEVAWLGALLVDAAVFDHAMDRSTGDEWRIRLWTDVLRRVDARHVPAPGCLLAHAAWCAGRGPLARVALDRTLQEAPGHRVAGTLDRVLSSGLGPHAVVAFTPPDQRATRTGLGALLSRGAPSARRVARRRSR
ncbi:DUF4192 domain-containing protein [Actinoplanes sp. TBRC 11911]|uniref:DUF4192 domain-containing protein n=1 Tax=Actinoplanes sp. TBRC 11911 TaxID=2729386 RepID=UPI00145D090D|nr:DUF4192 domain-containing protein [Actinoplanes sp. TBRC 11911]NMO54452.1 DUF4192 domain-containing protein [Actinoplanes sp. TBRC 11911]